MAGKGVQPVNHYREADIHQGLHRLRRDRQNSGLEYHRMLGGFPSYEIRTCQNVHLFQHTFWTACMAFCARVLPLSIPECTTF